MNYNRQRMFRESTRFTPSKPKQTNSQNTKNKLSHKKTIRCKYCYRTGHLDTKCPDKDNKRPPSMPEWISKATYLRCKEKGHLAFICPPKYPYKVVKANTGKNNMGYKISANNVKEWAEIGTYRICWHGIYNKPSLI